MIRIRAFRLFIQQDKKHPNIKGVNTLKNTKYLKILYFNEIKPHLIIK
ncbi:uncharacterized protein MP3633_2464 [Marinomonas primoryensis]|uniref:Uncharacterized protein n=1 Tax=Marinomonas primoryensis TaxID=178399 RepID=A0A859D2V1_9GAMM|nr:uncharacterized protein MP3633_2464 [Marinomonas primoryensis]